MPLPFSSRTTALLFASLLLGALLLPWLLPKQGARRRESYDSLPGQYEYAATQIFNKKSPVDIAFIGASFLWRGIDTAYVRQRLSDELGRPAEVFTLAGHWPGEDRTFIFVKEPRRAYDRPLHHAGRSSSIS